MRSSRRATMGLAAATAAVLWLGPAGCGEGGESAKPTPPPQATAAPEPEPSTEATPAPPAAAEPAAGSARSGDAKRGQALYAQYCASCHGAGGEGDGPVAASLNPKPVRHTDGAYMNQLSDQHLFKVIKEGGAAVGKSPLMAPWGGTLSDDQIWDLVAFVRTLADPPYQP